MNGYATPQPVDRYGNVLQTDVPPAAVALSTTVSGTLLSSVITLLDTATTIEVSTGNGAAAIKWFGSVVANPSVITSTTTANFDNVIPANWVRKFVIPTSVQGIANAGSVVGGFGAQNGLYKQLAVIPFQTTAPTSIMVTQY